MNKKIKKLLTVSVTGMLVFKNVYYTPPIDNPIVTFSKDDNVAIGLCYHRIIDNDLYNEFLKFAVHPDELVKYSVDEKHFEENIKFLLDSKCKFLTLDEFIKCKVPETDKTLFDLNLIDKNDLYNLINSNLVELEKNPIK